MKTFSISDLRFTIYGRSARGPGQGRTVLIDGYSNPAPAGPTKAGTGSFHAIQRKRLISRIWKKENCSDGWELGRFGPLKAAWQNVENGFSQGIDEAMPSKPGFSTQVVDFPRIVGGKNEIPRHKDNKRRGKLDEQD